MRHDSALYQFTIHDIDIVVLSDLVIAYSILF